MLDEPGPSRPNGELAGQIRPKALLLDRPRGLPTPVYCFVMAEGLLKLLSQFGLFALNICTAPPRAEAWAPLLAKSDGTLKVLDPFGSIDRSAPSFPAPIARRAP